MSEIRRKKAIKKILGSKGCKNIGKALVESGYSPAYAKNPKLFMETASTKEIMKTIFSEKNLAKKHEQLLNQSEIKSQGFNPKLKDKTIKALFKKNGIKVFNIQRGTGFAVVFYFTPDATTQTKALDMSYKLLGKYAPEKMDVHGLFANYSNQELAELLQEARGFFKKD